MPRAGLTVRDEVTLVNIFLKSKNPLVYAEAPVSFLWRLREHRLAEFNPPRLTQAGFDKAKALFEATRTEGAATPGPRQTDKTDV